MEEEYLEDYESDEPIISDEEVVSFMEAHRSSIEPSYEPVATHTTTTAKGCRISL